MNITHNKKILITLFNANGMHGAVRYSAELGKFFHSIGYDVYVCAVVTSDTTNKYYAKNNVTAINISEFPTDIEFDIVWTHHWPVLPYLIYRGLKYKRIINSTISSILFIERPLWFTKNIDLHLTLTEKTRKTFIKNYGISKNKIFVLPNTAPDEYFEYPHTVNQNIKSVAVVSNHPPQEVLDALQILQNDGIDTIVYGKGNSIDITPEVLDKHDVIITIGKTVQYCLAMQIPVYNYDYFGGSGYITTQNISKEGKHNFSGRSFFTKKTAEQIANEIRTQYDSIKPQLVALKQIATQRYKLSDKIQQILNLLYTKPMCKPVKITPKNRLFFEYAGACIDLSAAHNNKHVNTVDLERVNDEISVAFIPKFIGRIICCFIPIAKYRRKFRRKYVKKY